MKGGGDAVSAARAVLQTGEYRLRLEHAGRGRHPQAPGAGRQGAGRDLARRQPRAHPAATPPIRGPRSTASAPRSRRSIPLLSDPAVRQALNLLVDRSAVHEQIYGRLGQTSANYLNAPSRFRSQNTKWEFNVDKANAVLDAAGWKRGADGIRAKDGKRLKLLFQTSINAPRQKTQAIVKQAARQGRHRDRAQVGDRLGVLLLRRGEPGYLPALLRRHPDVHDDHGRARPGAVHDRSSSPRRRPPRTTSGRAGTSPAGATRSTTACGGPPRPRWTRSSGPRSSSR